MIKIENTIYPAPEQWIATIMGARNPMNSWDKSDSKIVTQVLRNREIAPGVESLEWVQCEPYISIGSNDLKLLMNLRNSGTPDHRKFMRMIDIYVDITAPLYWWKEFDTYKIGTTANSCSTMHKIHAKEFTIDDFSHECLHEEDGVTVMSKNSKYDDEDVLKVVIRILNANREKFIETKQKQYWYSMIQLLPTSYNQKRTIKLNYEVLANMYKSRKNHKLDEWHVLCRWIEKLPYSELITGGTDV